MVEGRAELCGAAVVVATAAFFFFWSFDIPLPMTGDALGPRGLPMALSGIMLCLGTVQAVAAFRHLRLPAARPAAARGDAVVVLVTIFVFAYAAGILLVGYPLATALFGAAFYRLFGRHGILVSLLAGAAFAAAFSLLFMLGLKTQLPTGLVWSAL